MVYVAETKNPHQRLSHNIDPKKEACHLQARQTDQPLYCSRIPTPKRMKLRFSFLPHGRCTRSTDDCCSSMCAKASVQRLPGTADTGRSASPCAPDSRTVSWRGSLKKTWSSIPGHRCELQPRPPPPIPAHRCELRRRVPPVLTRAGATVTGSHRQHRS